MLLTAEDATVTSQHRGCLVTVMAWTPLLSCLCSDIIAKGSCFVLIHHSHSDLVRCWRHKNLFLLNRRTPRPGCEHQASSQMSGVAFSSLRKAQGEEESEEDPERKAGASGLRAMRQDLSSWTY